MKALRKSRPLMILAALVLALTMSVPASAATEELLAPADGQEFIVGDEVTVVVNPGLYKYFYAHGSTFNANNFIYVRVTRAGERVCYERLGYKSVQNISMSFTWVPTLGIYPGCANPNLFSTYSVSSLICPARRGSKRSPLDVLLWMSAYAIAEQMESVSGFLCPRIYTFSC